MSVQAELDTMMDELASSFFAYTDAQADRIANRINRIRIEINDILSDYAKVDDTVSKSRINSLLRELDEIESEIGLELSDEIESSIIKAVERAGNESSKALKTVLGSAAIIGGIVVVEIVDFVLKRKGKDGLILADRINSLAGLLRDEMQQAIRYGVLRGETVTQIARRVKTAFDSAVWQIKRIVQTELPIAFRVGIAKIGEKTNVVKAIKIIDEVGRASHPSRHHYHECYRLANQDKYGMGKGIYLPQDTFIFAPHPNCTAYYRYILRGDAIVNG
mgnify:CR=1 FL=1